MIERVIEEVGGELIMVNLNKNKDYYEAQEKRFEVFKMQQKIQYQYE